MGVIAGPYCYVLHNQKLNFEMAVATCLEKNGRLAWMKTAHRYEQVMEYVLQHDAITDRSIIYAWTKMKREDFPDSEFPEADDESHFMRWVPGYPRTTPTFNHLMWQIVSSRLFADHGYINVPDAAYAYPLCQHKLEGVCKFNQVYQDCGTSCPLLCENQGSGMELLDDTCHQECKEGCGCPPDVPYLTDAGYCVKTAEDCLKPTTTEEPPITSTPTMPPTTTTEPSTSTRPTTTKRTTTLAPTTTQGTPEPTTTVGTTKPTTTAESSYLSAQRMAMLEQHNIYRVKHQAPPMTLSDTVNQDAQTWADYLARVDKFEHAPWADRNGQGENLARFSRSSDTVGQQSTTMWYNEVANYDFNNPVFGMNTGHFTQVVWVKSTELGVGVATSASGKVYVVARYLPSGNWSGQFATNVLPAIN